ncbi:MAG: TonB-dependent receptor [Candidatus Marinimicrobia bacterium]|nr:TonB-dependent receptor [Candidatus Neomarinimicrobiota bacterium]
MISISNQIFPFILGGILAAQSGNISGFVFDISTGLPLVGANVVLIETGSGTATNPNGAFRVDPVPFGKHTLSVTMIGYAAETVSCEHLSDKKCSHPVYLTPIVLESNIGVHVFGQRQTNNVFQYIQETNLSSTENMISMVEGVSLLRRGSYAQEPIIRGLSGGQVTVTINGMKSFGACTDRMDPVSSYVEAEALNSVEIGKGSLSLIHGSTVGGSINMTFLPPEISPTPYSLSSTKGDYQSAYQEKKVSVGWQRKASKCGFSLNGVYRKAEDYKAAHGEIIPFTAYEKLSFSFGYLRQVENNVQILFELISDDAWDIGYASLPMDVGYARMRMVGLTVKTSGVKEYLPRVELKVYGNSIDHWMDDSKRNNLFMNMHMDMPGFTRTVGSYLDIVFAHKGVSSLTLRSDFYWNSSYADMVMYPESSTPMKMVTWPDVHRLNLGQYLGYQNSISSKTTIKSSLRYDAYFSSAHNDMGRNLLHIYYPDNDLARIDHLVSGNVSLVHRFNELWQSTVAMASGSRIPTITEAYGYYLYNPEDSYLYLGNPDLPNENCLQYELRNRISTNRVDFTANLYRYDFRNYIVGQTMDTSIALGYANGWKLYSDGGEARIVGTEISLLYRFNPSWILLSGLNIQIGELTDLHDYIPFISPAEVHTSIKYQQKSLWVQFEAKGAGKQNRVSELSGENYTPEFAVYSIKSEYHFSQRFTLNLGIENLTNRLYHEHLDWGDIYRPGRNFVFSLMLVK